MRPNDSWLEHADLRKVQEHARRLLDAADAWNRFPTPVDQLLAAAAVKVAPKGIFDPTNILNFFKANASRLASKATRIVTQVKSALSKILGLYDAQERVIHIDETLGASKRNFIKLHEAGHHQLPTHRQMFGLFQDCEQTLAPEISDQFEREANNFARFVLFQGDTYAQLAADSPLEIKTPIKLAKKFGASIYASAREFARTNHRECIVYVLEPIEYVEGFGAQATVRRIEPSPSFTARFHPPQDHIITLDHPFGSLLPIGRRMTRPRQIVLQDKNGLFQECLAEAFDTTFNVIILIYTHRSLNKKSIIVFPQ
ncbi:MAG: ImmA/IrrE family metallo-endopeptidase [Vulcanimicrobiota bacterium]